MTRYIVRVPGIETPIRVSAATLTNWVNDLEPDETINVTTEEVNE